MAREKLDGQAVAALLAGLENWALAADGRSIRRKFEFKNFSEAFAFMTRVALIAEQHDHHPDWSNVYNRVTIDLWTHDAGGITESDVKFAQAVSSLVDPR